MLKLTVGFSPNPRVAPLVEGAVRAENIQLGFVPVLPGELFLRNLKVDEFDVFEMSISDFLIARERGGDKRWRWSGLPVFLSKAFLWLNLFVNTSAGIRELGDLRGKRVGVPDYPMTAALWMRIFLRELYGIEPGEITWYVGRLKDHSHGGVFDLDRNPPPGVRLNWLTADQTFDVMLDRGEIDAAHGFLPRPGPHAFEMDRYGGTPTTGNPRMKKLFEDGGSEIIKEYFRKVGVLPANHMVAVQQRVLEDNPWVALELFKAFQKSKEVAYERARQLSSAYLLFEGEDFRKQAELFGADPYPLGLEKNRKMLEIIVEQSHREGLTKERARFENLFHPSTLST